MKSSLKYITSGAAVLLSLHTVVQSSLAETEQTDIVIVVIKQEQLEARQPGDLLSKRNSAESLEGTDVAIDRLPAIVSAYLECMAARVAPRIEFSVTDPKEAIRFLVRKPKPKNMISLGLISDHQVSESDPAWFVDLQFGNKKLSCTVTNASLLDFSILLADSLDCELGVTPGGEALFRSKTQQSRSKYPAYIVKRKPKESK